MDEIRDSERPRLRDVPQRIPADVAILIGVRQRADADAIQHHPHNSRKRQLRLFRRRHSERKPGPPARAALACAVVVERPDLISRKSWLFDFRSGREVEESLFSSIK